MTSFVLLLNHEAATRIRSSGRHGTFATQASSAHGAATVVAVSDSSGNTVAIRHDPRNHFLGSGTIRRNGLWFRTSSLLHELGYAVGARVAVLTRNYFASLLEAPLPAAGGAYFVITFAPDASELVPDLCAWRVSPDGVDLLDLDVQPAPEHRGVAQLAPGWPVASLGGARVLVVGVGSIGSATAHCLAHYGVGHLDLLDPDRLRWHNLVRHTCGQRHVGAHKVDALRDDLGVLRPDIDVRALRWDVVVDADRVRGLLDTVDLVVCCADGVTPRRVVSHLARRASKTAILSCVLDDGGIGEIIRLRPWPDHGCLTCRRDALLDDHGIEPEPALDARYGSGTAHRPMTAVGGDLDVVGSLTAAIAVSTLRNRAGHSGQRLPGEHAAVALQPNHELAAPFDFTRSLQVRWFGAQPPRSGCPTCIPDKHGK